jgi:hypothetical protein
VVLYGRETWEEHKLRVFESRMRRIFGLKRDELTGGWRKIHYEELHDLYSLPSIIRMIKSRDEVGGTYDMNGGEEECV